MIALFIALGSLEASCTPAVRSMVADCSAATSLGCSLQAVGDCSTAVMSWSAWARCVAERALPCASGGLTRCALMGLGPSPVASVSSGLSPSARVAMSSRLPCDGERVEACIGAAGHLATKAAAVEVVSACLWRKCGVEFDGER